MRNEKLIAECWNVLESETMNTDLAFFLVLHDTEYKERHKESWIGLFEAATSGGVELFTPDGVHANQAAKFYFVCFILCAEGEM